MNRLTFLKKQFARTPAVRNSKMRIEKLGDGMAEVSIPIRNRLFTHHDLVAGYMIFGVANMAGAYAAITRIGADEEIAAKKIIDGEYIEAAIKEDKILVAKANVTGGRRWVDSKGRKHQEIVAMVTVRNAVGVVKAEFTLLYKVVPHAVLEKVVQRIRESTKEKLMAKI